MSAVEAKVSCGRHLILGRTTEVRRELRYLQRIKLEMLYMGIILQLIDRSQRGITARGGKRIRREIFRSEKAVFPQEYFVYFKGKRRISGGKDPAKAADEPCGIAL